MARSTAESATRDRILVAAVDVFARKGYHGAGVEDIVAASGTSKGAFYHYFASKQAIFLTLMDNLAAVVEQGVESAISAEQGAMAKVEAAPRGALGTARRAGFGALNEIISQWLLSRSEDLTARLPALRTVLLRSIGATP